VSILVGPPEYFRADVIWTSNNAYQYMPATIFQRQDTAERALANFRKNTPKDERWKYTLHARDVRASGATFRVYVITGRRAANANEKGIPQ
jgi:hypothetical protein